MRTPDILGIWIGQHESAKFWAGVLNDLKSRSIKDVYLFCVGGLNGFQEAIAAAYPQSQIQRCIIHQIRSSTRYVGWKDIWGKQHPSCVKNWDENWDILFSDRQAG